MNSFWTRMGLLVAVVALPAMVGAQAAPRVLGSMTFDRDTDGWSAMGPAAKVSVCLDSANVKAGSGSLKFDYSVAKGQMNLLMMTTQGVPTDEITGIRFWVKSDYAAPMAVVLQEADGVGGRYLCPFAVPAGAWQQVVLSLSEFQLQAGKDDPKDPNGKLDPGQIAGVGILDLNQLFVQADGGPVAQLLNVKPGAHALYIDDIEALAGTLPVACGTIAEGYIIDSFARPQASWMVLGTGTTSVEAGAPMTGRHLKVTYKQAPQKAMGLVRSINVGALKGVTRFTISAASTVPVKLLVQFEETSGGKYNAMVDVPEGNKATLLTIKTDELTAADDSKDNNGKLDLDQVKQVMLLDTAVLFASSEKDNVLRIGEIRALK